MCIEVYVRRRTICNKTIARDQGNCVHIGLQDICIEPDAGYENGCLIDPKCWVSLNLGMLFLHDPLVGKRENVGHGVGADNVAILAAADIVGIRAVIVHAKDEGARRFYEHFDFDPSPIDPLLLFLLTKEISRLIIR
jgi:hypothetical protein